MPTFRIQGQIYHRIGSLLPLPVIKADKAPKGRYNAPISNDIGIVMTGTVFESRDIVIEYRDTKLKRVSETHRWLMMPFNIQ